MLEAQMCQCYRPLVRSRLLRIAAIALLLGLPPAMRVERSLACVCSVPTPQEAYEHADVVVAGSTVRLHEGESDGVSVHTWEFKVSMVWKGRPYETIWVRSFFFCGAALSEDDRDYIVYASVDPRDETTVVSSVCTGSRPLAPGNGSGGDYLRSLGEGQPPELGTTSPKPRWLEAATDTAVPSWAIGLMVGGAVILAGGGFVALRRRGIWSARL